MLEVSTVKPGTLEQRLVKAPRSELAVISTKDKAPGKSDRSTKASARR
jgi:hypothetical protein